MRKVKILSLLAVAILLFSSCARDTVHAYAEEGHVHVYGNPYEVEAETCLCDGSQVRYCKICHEVLVSALPVPQNIEERKHEFDSVVTEATESTEGYTTMHCRQCTYVTERMNVVPAKYALLTDESVTLTTAPAGVTGVAMSDTTTHVLRYNVGMESVVPAVFAGRLAVALTMSEVFKTASLGITPQTRVTLQTGSFSGNTYPLSALLTEWLENGGADMVHGMALALGESEQAFALRVAERLARLGLTDGVSFDIYALETGNTTLYAATVLLARVMDEPFLVSLLERQVGALDLVAGEKPTVYYAEAGFRVTALAMEEGYRFALLCGSSLGSGVENTLYGNG